MDYQLSPEQSAMVDGVARILEPFGDQYFRSLEDDAQWPWEAMAALGEHGFVGILAPAEYGGSDGTTLDAMICLEEAVKHMGGTAMAYFTTMCFGVRALSTLGTEDQKKNVLPGLIAGTSFVGLSLTEPSGGTDILGAINSRGKRTSDTTWTLNGSKVFTTGAHIADHLIVVVRTSHFEERRSKGLTMFLVPTDAPGLEVQPIPVFAQRSTGANHVFLTDVEVDDSQIIGREGEGLRALFEILNDERIGAATMSVGIAQAALGEALEYAKEREAFARPIGQFQAVQHALADAWVRIEAARQLVYKAAWLQSNGLPAEMESSAAKLFASTTCIDVVNECMEILGGYSYTLDFNMSYYLRDGRYTFAPVTNNAVRNLIGERLGLPKSY